MPYQETSRASHARRTPNPAWRFFTVPGPVRRQEATPQWEGSAGMDEFQQAHDDLLIGGRAMKDYFEPRIPRHARKEQHCWDARGRFDNMYYAIRATICNELKGYIDWVAEILGAEGEVVAVVLGCTTPMLLLRRHGDGFKGGGEA
ncbi:hypothetical protein NHQ30_003528 [Ciborinia camelliae]|nr:hypothetical protein NHQ30_003528 [Ciborinia camelliae]